jgi:hypothetical protein
LLLRLASKQSAARVAPVRGLRHGRRCERQQEKGGPLSNTARAWCATLKRRSPIGKSAARGGRQMMSVEMLPDEGGGDLPQAGREWLKARWRRLQTVLLQRAWCRTWRA